MSLTDRARFGREESFYKFLVIYCVLILLDYVIFSSVWSGKHLTKGKIIVKIIKL